MSGRTYTVARVSPANGLPLFEQQVRRLGESARGALRHFASQGLPGVYRLWWDGVQLTTLKLEGSALFDGMPTRYAVSPFAAESGRFAKPSPPSAYDSVRIDGVATLLTDARGEVVLESCRAAVLAWDGAGLVLPPETVGAVRSVSEAEVAEKLSPRRAPIRVDGGWPLLLLNAVETCTVACPGRAVFPPEVRARVDALVKAD